RAQPPGLDLAKLEEARGLSSDQLPATVTRLTQSAKELLRSAATLMGEVGPGKPVGGRHVLAAYFYRPPGHLDDYEAWKLDRRAWASRLFEQLDLHHPDEIEAWLRLHRSEFSVRLTESVEGVERRAASLAVEMSPPVERVDSRLLLAAVLLEGDRRSTEKLACRWLAKTVPGDRASLLGLTAVPMSLASAKLPEAPDVQAVLARAGVIASVTNGQGVVRGRHLVGALLWEPLARSADEFLSKAGVERRDWAGRLVAGIEPWAAKAEKEGWRLLLAALDSTTVRFAGYDNDDPAGEDRLNTQRDVLALAAVLASKHIPPPLSVGLFG